MTKCDTCRVEPCGLSTKANPGRIVEMCGRYDDGVQRRPSGEKATEGNQEKTT